MYRERESYGGGGGAVIFIWIKQGMKWFDLPQQKNNSQYIVAPPTLVNTEAYDYFGHIYFNEMVMKPEVVKKKKLSLNLNEWNSFSWTLFCQARVQVISRLTLIVSNLKVYLQSLWDLDLELDAIIAMSPPPAPPLWYFSEQNNINISSCMILLVIWHSTIQVLHSSKFLNSINMMASYRIKKHNIKL